MNKQLTLVAKMVGFVLTTTLATQSFGAAFQSNYQSIPVASMAWAGRATNTNDATAIATNPAGLSALETNSVSAGFAVVDPSSSISNTTATLATPRGTVALPGTTDGDMGQTVFIPSIYVALPAKFHGLSAGLGIYGSYGFDTQYEDTFKGIQLAAESKVKVATVQPTISYKYNEKLSLGAGLTINKAEGILTSSSALTPSTISNPNYRSRLDADDYGYGVNLGVMYRITPEARLGLTYKSRVKYDLSGDASVVLPPNLGGSTVSGDGNLSIKTPDSVDLAGTYDFSPRLAVSGTIAWTGWSVLESIQVKTDLTGPTAAVTSALQNPPAEQLNYKDTWLYSVGANYKINPKFTVRGGYAYDTSPVDINSSVRMPSSDRNILTVGLGYRPTDRIGFDFLYGYVHEGDADVSASKTTAAGTVNFSSTYQNRYNLYGAQLNYKF